MHLLQWCKLLRSWTSAAVVLIHRPADCGRERPLLSCLYTGRPTAVMNVRCCRAYTQACRRRSWTSAAVVPGHRPTDGGCKCTQAGWRRSLMYAAVVPVQYTHGRLRSWTSCLYTGRLTMVVVNCQFMLCGCYYSWMMLASVGLLMVNSSMICLLLIWIVNTLVFTAFFFSAWTLLLVDHWDNRKSIQTVEKCAQNP